MIIMIKTRLIALTFLTNLEVLYILWDTSFQDSLRNGKKGGLDLLF